MTPVIFSEKVQSLVGGFSLVRNKIRTGLSTLIFEKALREDANSLVSLLPLETAVQIYSLVYLLNYVSHVTPQVFLAKIQFLIKEFSNARVFQENAKTVREKLKNEKEEAIQLGVLRKNDSLPKDEPYMELMNELLKHISILKNEMNCSPLDISVKEEINCLQEYLIPIIQDRNHIAAYNLALMTNVVLSAIDNFNNLHDIVTVKKLNGIINSVISICAIDVNKLQTVQSSYPSNKNQAIQLDARKLETLKLLIDYAVFWTKRGNPIQIKNMLAMFNEKDLNADVMWGKMKDCAGHQSGWFDKPHKDVTELCQAILKDNIDAMNSILNKAIQEAELEVEITPISSSLKMNKK